MFSKSNKRLSVFLSATVLSVFLSGIHGRKAEAFLPNYILVPLTIQAAGYTLPRAYKQLTPQERKQVDAVRNRAFREIASVLTQAQRSQIMKSLKTPQGRRELLKSMRFTPQQKARIKTIVNRYRQRMNAIIDN